MFRKILPLCFLLGLSTVAWTQDGTAVVRGRLVAILTGDALPDLQLAVPRLQLLSQSDATGMFRFEHVPFGTYELVVGGVSSGKDTLQLVVDREDTDMGDVPVRRAAPDRQRQHYDIPTIALEDNDLKGDEDGGSVQGVSSMLVASRDPFLNTAAFVFGPYRFQPRGYNSGRQQIFINDVPVNDVETGNTFWNQWGGLNDVFRARNQTYGLAPSPDAFGGVNGSLAFDATAINQQKQTRVTYSLSNRQYRNRLMLTHSSGLMKGGWAYTVSASHRWAKEGFIDGTFYDGYSYFAGFSKLYRRHQLSLTAFGAPTRRGKSAPAIQEVYDLAGSNFYNPNWGYQDGEKRNARVANSYQPVYILNHQYAPGERFRIYTAVSYQSGKSGNSSLDWYNARDPRPDYYRYLPSWQLLENNDQQAAADIRDRWKSDPGRYAQIDWDRIYQVNYANVETVRNADGVAGNDVTGRKSVYVIGNDIDDIHKYSFNTHAEKKFNDRLTVSGGITAISQQTESYRELEDLLGGDFYQNLNQFAVQQSVPDVSFNQYDLDHPDRLIREGDKYNYYYITRFNIGRVWAQGIYKTKRLDFFLAANGGKNGFYREGKFRNGLFPDASKGKSEVLSFTTYGTKGGATWKINGRNYLFLNGGLYSDAPTIENTFISARTRNLTVADPRTQITAIIEGGYMLRTPGYRARVTGYVTDAKDVTQIKRFYNDDPAYQTFVNYVLQGVDMRFIGLELALEARLTRSLSLTAVAAPGQAFYTSNPSVSVYRDNDTMSTSGTREVYIRNHYVAAGPQSAYSLGLSYRPRSWWVNVSFNYFDRNYIDINPDRRTEEAGDLIDRGTPLYSRIFKQEKMPAAFTVDLSVSKSFPLSRIVKSLPYGTYLYLSTGVSNLLNNTDIRTGGFEQLRYDFSGNNPQKFPPKYFYGYGANYFINISLKF